MRLLFQAHQCPGNSATFSNPGKKNCGRFGRALFFWGFMFGARSSATCLNHLIPLKRSLVPDISGLRGTDFPLGNDCGAPSLRII